eukprot:CAMPEP_0177792380 /NCGR_PEP_ID=MMETSP0491_2-20121128/24494_1 /TAXON_ID=63592 /ORGANISM="Tetraselmis chuii, Strain PLY429" /LENGTH=1322 /DNA_ID=CAMNT_0019314791 /DNA_START=221 /DNA_END=4189 /DNA_ORIENTATION=-
MKPTARSILGVTTRRLLALFYFAQLCRANGPRRGCRVEVDLGGEHGGTHVYWRLTPEECQQEGPQRRALQRPGEGGDCGEVHRWLAKWNGDDDVARSTFEAACDGNESGDDSRRWSCFQNFVGLVQAIDADECGVRAYIDEYAKWLEVIERDAEEQLSETQRDEMVEVEDNGGAGGRRRVLQGGRKWVELNGLMEESVQWYLDRIDQRYLPLDGLFTYSNTASSTTIYVVDTGVYPDHEQFLTNVGGTSRVMQGYTAKTLTGASIEGRDCTGHGTGCASVAAGLWCGSAKSATVVPVSVTDCRGRGTQTDILDGLSWIEANLRAPAVLSMSLGTAVSDVLDAAILALLNKGVSVVAAAGRMPGVITVGATDRSDRRWVSPSGLSSNVGSCVDIFAPGEFFSVADIGSPVAQQGLSGTSVACPLVTGVVAQILHAYPHANPNNVKDTIQVKATPGAVTTVSVGTTKDLVNSWRVIDEAARDLDPYLVIQERPTSPPAPPPAPPPTPAPTMAPTTPAPTMAPGAMLVVDWDEATLPLEGLVGAGVTWHALAFGLPVLATAGCSAFDVRMATAALAMLLDANNDGKHDDDDLLGAMTANNATLLLYTTADGGDAVLAKLAAMGGDAMVVGLTCAGEDGSPITQRSGLVGVDDDENPVTPLLMTAESAEEAALCLVYLAGYARLFPNRLGWEQRGSELWGAVTEATQDCGFTEPALREEFGWSAYCTGIYSVYDNTCGAPCVAARYVQLALYALLGGLPTNAIGACPQRGLKWDTCDAWLLEQYNPAGFTLLSDTTLGLPTTLPSTAYFGDGSLPDEPTMTPLAPIQPLSPTPAPQPTPYSTPEETATPEATTLLTLTPSVTSSTEPQPTTVVADYNPVSLQLRIMLKNDIMDLVGAQGEFIAEIAKFADAPAEAATVVAMGSMGDSSETVYARVRLNANNSVALDAYVAALMVSAADGSLAAALGVHGLTLYTDSSRSAVVVLDEPSSDNSVDNNRKDGNGSLPVAGDGIIDSGGSTPSADVIVGTVCGVLLFVLLLLAGGLCWLRRRYRRLREQQESLLGNAVVSISPESTTSSPRKLVSLRADVLLEPSSSHDTTHDRQVEVGCKIASSTPDVSRCDSLSSKVRLSLIGLGSHFSGDAAEEVAPAAAPLARVSRQSSKTLLQSMFSEAGSDSHHQPMTGRSECLEALDDDHHHHHNISSPSPSRASRSGSESETSYLATYPCPSSPLDVAPVIAPLPALAHSPVAQLHGSADGNEQLNELMHRLVTEVATNEESLTTVSCASPSAAQVNAHFMLIPLGTPDIPTYGSGDGERDADEPIIESSS